MAPETRSRGVPPPSRVYNSSPALQQVQFPARRKKIRRYGDSDRRSLKQQTLTQIDFVSSFDEDDVVALSNSDDDIQGGDGESEDKENMNPNLADEQDENVREEEEEDKEDDEPISRGRKRSAPSTKESKKRRRTMGDDTDKVVKARKDDKSRRKTLGDIPVSSNYHTQTLTQFLGHQTSFIADSDDDLEPDRDGGDDGFLSWLGEPGSPSAGRGRRDFSLPAVKQRHDAAAASTGAGISMSREDSVIPQTPAKKSTTIRFNIPSGGLHSPGERMIDRYGAPDQQDSPLKNHTSPVNQPLSELIGEPRRATPRVAKQPSLVIEDSYDTEGWTTPSKSQVRESQKGTPTPVRASFGTPSKLNPVGDKGTPTKGRISRRKTPSPKKVTIAGVYEIPDSDEDDDGFGDEDDETEAGVQGEIAEEAYGAGAETQIVMSEIASTDGRRESCEDVVPCSTQTSKQNTQNKSASATGVAPPPTANQADVPSSPPTSTLPRPAPIRKPLHHPSGHTQTQSQPWESQRVPASILRSLPTPTARSDILLRISTTSLDTLVRGHTLFVTTKFKVPSQVVRFWLFENHLLRYMATIEPGQQVQPTSSSSSQGEWKFHASQVYELNNPVCEDDMREEGWLNGQFARYTYLPPAVVGQSLWNLRHAIFGDANDQQIPSSPFKPSSQPQPEHSKDNAQDQLPNSTPPGSMTVSQQITAQIRSDIASSTQFPTSDDLVPSTPDFNETLKPSSSRTTLPPFSASKSKAVRPSQATTVSQPSTPEKQTQQPSSMPPPPLFNTSDNSIQFIESGSPGSLPFPSSLGSTSQLLTKSQMLPDSLIRDHAPPEQPEIWDSEDDDAPL
ncbi:hypothetical protein VFPPC_01710 [Pochonia chlamydosporia 170]|uniref:Uncharacterized protein n=1 Tax=Pochonia chlamydosporia 170 TaxID=1380566 RepID=A0A179G8L4_METCM|nr:hypothetical protein VFPPC_01710 [Pochonia chlamydosporia 170]OAQ74146.1 hypothetical protein VFPPC_01710 [Pochonia chlamydosporia 170]